MPRPAIVVALPPAETKPVVAELKGAGFDAIAVSHPDDMAALLRERRDVAIAVLDGESDLTTSLEYYSLLHEEGRSVPALMIVQPTALERLEADGASADDEYFSRPYSAESIRWRVEAMCIRSATIDDGSGVPVLAGEVAGVSDWASRASVLVVFNPKGGVGKTTVATNLAAAIQARGDQRVLLIDADTVTGHILTSLGLDAATTVADAWRDEAETGEPAPPLSQIAMEHTSGMRVVALTNSPLFVDHLEPERVASAIEAERRGFDVIVIDLHPSYSALNRAMFAIADRILVPVTPDVPAIRAAIQLRDVSVDLGIRERLSMVVNRANSGVSVADMEKAIGMAAMSLVHSGGMLFVRAANEGKTVIDKFPKEAISDDFRTLSDKLLTPISAAAADEKAAAPKTSFRLFGRAKEAVRA